MTGNTYSWTVATVTGLSGYIQSGSGPKIASTTITNSTNAPLELIYRVVATNNGCQSTEHEFKITVNPAPVIADKTPLPICSGSSFTVTPSNVAGGDIVPTGTTYTWTIPTPNNNLNASAGSGLTITQNLINSSNTVQSVTYLVTPSSSISGSCGGLPFEVVVTVNPTPVISTQELVICSGDVFDLALLNGTNGDVIPAGTKYTWTIIPNPRITGTVNQSTPQTSLLISQPLTNTGTAVEVITYQITPTSGNGCPGASRV